MTDETNATSLSVDDTISLTTGSDVSGPRYADLLSTAGNRATGSAVVTDSGSRGRPTTAARPVPSYRMHQSKIRLRRCVEDIERIVGEDEPLLRADAFEQLKDQLSRLWSMRSDRESEFVEFMNMVQMVVVDREVTNFSDGQLESLQEVLQSAIEVAQFDDRFNDDATESLLRNGIDVFRELA